MGVTEVGSRDRVAGGPFMLALETLELDRDDFVIFGSGPMLAHGLRTIHDLDIVARNASWQWAREFGKPIADDDSRLPRVRFWVGAIEIEIGPKWYSPPLWDTDELIDNAEVIAGYRFARLDDVRRYKRALRRPKDVLDVAIIDAYLTGRRSGR